jgi:hypothetical protein
MLWMMLVNLVEQPAAGLLGQLRQVCGLFVPFRGKNFYSEYKIAWLAALTPVLVAGAYQFWLNASGFGLITNTLRKHWEIETVAPWTGVILFFQRLFTTKFIYMDWIDLALTAIVLLASLMALRLLDPAFSLYIWLTIGVLLTRGTPPHLLASYSRYFLALFPLFILPALIQNKYLRVLILVFSFSLQVLLVWIFLWGSWVA